MHGTTHVNLHTWLLQFLHQKASRWVSCCGGVWWGMGEGGV